MAHYIAYATEAGTSRPRQMLAQVHSMLKTGLWGVPDTAQLKAKLLPGDGLIVTVGAPYRQFVVDAVVASRYRRFSEDELAALPAGPEFDHGLTLTRTRLWPQAAPIADVWPRTTAARSNPRAHFRAGITSLDSMDAAIIVGAGTGSPPGGGSAQDRKLAEAEDDKVIALMNERRAAGGKPPLSAEQEQQVRESRRSQRG